jgi:TetR/AcrR family transcriptional regulator
MTSETKRGERLSGETRRAQIIDVALTLFAEKGFNGTRTREIAEAAGISETLIFQHFKTKDDLIRASMALLLHPHPITGELIEYLEKTDDPGFFRTMAMHFIKHNQEDPRILKLALHSSLEGGHFGELTSAEDSGPSMLDMITAYIQKRIDAGVFIEVNTEIAARLFVETVFMYLADKAMAISGPVMPYSDEKVVETLIGIFLNGLTKKQNL